MVEENMKKKRGPKTKEIKSKKINNFLNSFSSKGTRQGYKSWLKIFFEVIEKDADEWIVDVRLLENGERITILDGYEDDIKKFNQWLKEKEYAPKSVHNGLNAVRIFLKEYRIKLDDVVWEKIKRRGLGNKPIIRTPPLEKSVLKMILTHADARCRAAFLTLSQSGMRPNELVQLTPEDIDWTSDPISIEIKHGQKGRRVKDKEGRTVYITYEAGDAIREWMKVRQGTLELAYKRNNLGININRYDGRLFPISEIHLERLWLALLKKANTPELNLLKTVKGHGKTADTKPREIHVYSMYRLKDYFRTNFGKYDPDMAKYLMGHQDALTIAYVNMSEAERRQRYKKGQGHVLVFETSVDTERVDNMEEQLTEKDKEIFHLKKELKEVKSEMGNFQNLLDDPQFKMNMMSMIAKQFEKLEQEKNRILGLQEK